MYGEPEDAAITGYTHAHIKSLMEDLRIDVKDAKEAVTKEDTDRALFSLESSKGEILKYPNFAGDPGQEFVKFKEKMDYRFRRNRKSCEKFSRVKRYDWSRNQPKILMRLG